MKRVAEKLKCRRGASILLALLFLLVCVLVAMSVLMAAASNAGKIRSNREEQQKYFTLSSALNLVVGELTSPNTYYQGKYEITRSEETVWETNPDGSEKVDENGQKIKKYTFYRYSGKQLPGEFYCGLNETANVVLDLSAELDGNVFEKKAQKPNVTPPNEWTDFSYLAKPAVEMEHCLELTVSPLPEDSPGLGKSVKIDVTVKESGDIVLLAKFEGEDYISMEATLGAEIVDEFELELPTSDETVTGTTGKVIWKLDKITKKEGP